MASLAVSTLSFPQQHSNFHSPAKHTIRIKSSASRKPLRRTFHFAVNPKCRLISFNDDKLAARPLSSRNSKERKNPAEHVPRNESSSLVHRIARPVAYVLFCVAVGIFQARVLPATALPVLEKETRLEKMIEGVDKSNLKQHRYSYFTRLLLREVSKGLLTCVKEVRNGSRDVKELKAALKEVKELKEKLQKQIKQKMIPETKELRTRKRRLVIHLNSIVDKGEKLKAEVENVRNRKERITDDLRKRIENVEKEYGEAWEMVEGVDNAILKEETMAMSFGVGELCFIERECEELVKKVTEEVKLRRSDSLGNSVITKLSRSEIQKELETSQRMLLEQMILPKVVEVEGPGPLFGSDLMDFAEHVREGLAESRDLQSSLEDRIKKTMRIFGDEKNLVVKTPESILLDRDRVVLKTWYNDEKKRWEIDPVAVPYAVSKKLVEQARIRHDWGAMYITMKGDEKEYYLDAKEFEMYQEFGGFDGLYMKMIGNDIPATVHFMWIPLSELNIRQLFLLAVRLVRRCFVELWKRAHVYDKVDQLWEEILILNEDIMVSIVCPLIELVIPYSVRMRLGMAWPEESNVIAGSTWYLEWISRADERYKDRESENTQLFTWTCFRIVISGCILLLVFYILRIGLSRLFRVRLLQRRNPNSWKLRRVKAYMKTRRRLVKGGRKTGVDPIKTAFEQMKRVKNPPIPLKNFSSIESMREEINEVVAFLRNPSAFQEMGARAPRGVLIVGERGTGKTSLALAIASEARVPVVKVEAQQLEAGLWVGQSASNVRELFQTARDLAPVIIFVEDFDLFAGVRGKFLHTKNQDHEAFINQLLVELDGFEKQDGVVLMATTTDIRKIDKALQRPGRMDRVFRLQRPTQGEREKILRTAAKETMDEELIDFVNWSKVSEKTAILRPTELKLVPVALEGSAFRSKFLDADELLSYCSWFATFTALIPQWVRKTTPVKKMSRMLVNHLGLELTREDMWSAVDLMEPYGLITNGLELLNPLHDWTKESKLPHAVWAAGRGLIATLLPNFDVVDNLWLEPYSWQGIGCTKINRLHGSLESRAYLEKKLVFCFGSYVASRLLLPLGEENFLSASELKQAQEIATRMVIQYGWGPDDSPAIYYSAKAITSLSMGNKHELEQAAKVEKMYDLAYFKAKEILQQNRRVLEKMVDELLKFEILSAKDMQRIIEENGGIREKEPFTLLEVYHREPASNSFLEVGNGPGPAALASG
ncbi:Probable inactive ATP-dependent zinc metalloprotease FTSHI 5, chloroplastic [Linum perenne]